LITVREGTSLHKVVKSLQDNAISGLPVLDADGILTGVITVSDLVCQRTRRQDRNGRPRSHRGITEKGAEQKSSAASWRI
jgi:CBS domain-containing protein